MSRHVPLRRCRRCVRFNGHACHLDDLQPCDFIPTPEAENQRAVDAFLFFVTAIALLVGAFLFVLARTADQAPAPAPEPQSAVQLLREQHQAADGLTDWQLLQMAIIWTESKCNPDALGATQDAGLYQMTPVYVREVNRVAGTDYAHADAFDPALAVEIFAAMQDHYNPAHDPDRAIYYHNKGAAYRAEVLANLALVRRYETARKYVTQ